MGCSYCIGVQDKKSSSPAQVLYGVSQAEKNDFNNYKNDCNHRKPRRKRKDVSNLASKFKITIEKSIDIVPTFEHFEQWFKPRGSTQRHQVSAWLSQLPPAQIQGSATSSASYEFVDTLLVTQVVAPGLWDDVFSEELEFLEEVFYDDFFRSLSNEADNEKRLNNVRSYVMVNESWAFASFDKKHSFVTNVLLLYKAYLPKNESSQSYFGDSRQHPSYSEQKISASALKIWWLDYVEEMSSRYNSMFSFGDGGEGVELLISKLFENRQYPASLVTQLKPDLAKWIWTQYEKEITNVKKNMKESFDLIICPSLGEEDQQDFLNKYISRSFIPKMLFILSEVLWYINSHACVVEFDRQSEKTPASKKNNLFTLRENFLFYTQSNSYISKLHSPASISTLMSAAGGPNNDTSFVQGSPVWKSDSNHSSGNEVSSKPHSNGLSSRADEDLNITLQLPKRCGHGLTNKNGVFKTNSDPVLQMEKMDVRSIQRDNVLTEGKELELFDPSMNTKSRSSISEDDIPLNLHADSTLIAQNYQQQRESDPFLLTNPSSPEDSFIVQPSII